VAPDPGGSNGTGPELLSANGPSDVTEAPGAYGGGAPGRSESGLSGPLAFLGELRNAKPSDFAPKTAALATPAGSSMAAAHEASSLAARPAPTGLDPGPPIPAVPVPAVALVPLAAPDVAGGPAGGLEPSGATDPAVADRWAAAGSGALEQTAASAESPPPTFGPALRPSTGAELAQHDAGPPMTAPPGVPSVAVGDEEGTALDRALGPQLQKRTAALLEPAGAASSEHETVSAGIRADVDRQVSGLRVDTAAQQQSAGQHGDQEVAQLHAGWTAERAGIVTEHRTAISAASAQARAEATQTIEAGNAEAKQRTDAAEQAQSGEQKSSGWWDKIKSAGSKVAGAIAGAAGAVLGVVTNILAAARQKVVGVLQSLGAAVRSRIAAAGQALRSGVARVWSAIRQAAARAQQVVSALAAKAVDFAKRVWAEAAERLAKAWAALKQAVSRAFQAARALVDKVVSALSTLREILKILSSKMLDRLFEAVKDPEGKILPIIVAKAQPLVGQVPTKADELASEKANGPPPQPAAPQASAQATVQRAPITADEASDLFLKGKINEKETPIASATAGEGFFGGVWRHMQAAGRHFLDNWLTILRNVVFALLTFYPVLLQEAPKLWEEAKGVINGGGGVDRFDHVLGVLRHLVNIVAGLVATTGIWALIIGALSGPGEVFVVGAYEAVSAGVIGTDFTLGVAEMVKAWASATAAGVSSATREIYLGMFSGSAIAAAILVILVALGAIASRLAKAFRRTAPEAAESAKAPPAAEQKPAAPESKSTGPTPAEDPNAKPGTKPETEPDGLKGGSATGEGPVVCQRACLPQNEIENARRAQHKKSAQALDQGVDTNGHSNADHGAQTTDVQHKRRLETGETPGGDHRPIPDSSSKFATNAAQVDAYEKALNELGSNSAGPNSYMTTGGRMKVGVTVTVASPGCGFVFTLDAAGNLVRTRANGFTAIFRLNSQNWYDLITMFPTP
jgi:hypothetical protein